MSTQSVSQARTFVQQAELPAPRPEVLGETVATPDFVFEKAKEQAAVVGSDVIAFVKGITPEQRMDLVNASTLAQLVAKTKVPAPTNLSDVLEWYKSYFNTLSNIGFAVQEQGFAEYTEDAKTFEAHEAILEVAKVVLAGAPAALTIVTKTLESLKKMSADSPWITLFHRESRSAKTARFQVTLAEPDENAGLLVTMMAFGMEAKATVTQVLFFKFKKNEAKLQHHSGKVTINTMVLSAVRDDIAEKLKVHAKSFIAGLPPLPTAPPPAMPAPSPGGGG
jgi:hypothetical protein